MMSPVFSKVFTKENELWLKKNNLLTTIPKLGKEWKVSLDYRPTSTSMSDWSSVFRMTIGGENGNYGDRIAFIHPNRQMRLYVCSPINGDPNHNKGFNPPPLHKWTNIEVAQRLDEGSYWYTIKIGGEEVFKVKNSQPEEFSDVKVFAADPWQTTQPGYVRNITIETSEGNYEQISTTTSIPYMSTTTNPGQCEFFVLLVIVFCILTPTSSFQCVMRI